MRRPGKGVDALFCLKHHQLGVPPQQGKQSDLILPGVQQKLHLVGGEEEDVREGEKLHHRVPQGLLAGPESRAERGDKADRHTGGAGGVQRGCQQRLHGKGFLRCNKCYLVNQKHIQTVTGSDVVLSNGEKLQISRLRKKELARSMGNEFVL